MTLSNGQGVRKTTMSREDIEALQTVRVAARVALDREVIHPSLRARVAAAAERVTAIIAEAIDAR